MSIYIGNTKIGQMYLGSTEIAEAYLASRKVYSSTPPSYDARVEYLRSSGTQYINTGLPPLANEVITIVFQATISQSTMFLGCRTSSSSGKCTIGSGVSNTKMYAALGNGNNTNLVDFDLNQHTVVLNTGTGKASIDGGEEVSVGSFAANNLNIYLFACNQAGVASYLSTIKIMSVTIGSRANFIPVRVGQVGYMYDTVSGKLFGNAGTGDFTFGNDVS